MHLDHQRLHGGRSWPIDYRHGRLSDRALDDARRTRARMPHGGAETAAHGAVARMTTKVPANDRAGASGRCGGFGVEANTHFRLAPQVPGGTACQRTARAPKPTSTT